MSKIFITLQPGLKMRKQIFEFRKWPLEEMDKRMSAYMKEYGDE